MPSRAQVSRNLEDGLARLRALLAGGEGRGGVHGNPGLGSGMGESSASTPPAQIARAAAAKRTEYNF